MFNVFISSYLRWISGPILVCSIAHFVQYWSKSVQYWIWNCAVLKFEMFCLQPKKLYGSYLTQLNNTKPNRQQIPQKIKLANLLKELKT